MPDTSQKPNCSTNSKRALAQLRQGNQVGWPDQRSAQDLLRQLELSYQEKKGHWKHGGLVGVLVMAASHRALQRCRRAIPNVAHFHTIRVNQPGRLVLYQ